MATNEDVTDSDKIELILQERPYVAQIIQTQLLSDIAGILYEQLATTKDAIPDLMKKYTFELTDSILEINVDKIPSLPWISFTLYNDGIDPVHVYVNEYGKEESQYISPEPTDPTIASGDTLVIDLKAPKIKKLIMFCDTGKTATVRIFAMMKEYRSQQREEIPIL